MIKEALQNITNEIPENVTLVAVSKTKPISAIQTAYDWGQRIFGENRAQELEEKAQALPKDISWHMIGHLQRNKVKYIAPYVDMIHAVDSLRLLKEIDKEAKKNNRVITVLLQFHIAEEESKYGLSLESVKSILEDENINKLEHIKLVGVMGMATFTDDKDQVRKEFQHLYSIFEDLKNNHFQNQDTFKTISMGMSGDYPIAIEEGSTMIRVGSQIFGSR